MGAGPGGRKQSLEGWRGSSLSLSLSLTPTHTHAHPHVWIGLQEWQDP